MSVEFMAACPCCGDVVRWTATVGTTVGYRIQCDRRLP